MNIEREIVATIAIENDGRAQVAIDHTDAGYEIVGILPDGTEEHPAISAQPDRDAALRAIHQSYCIQPWDLQWIEA